MSLRPRAFALRVALGMALAVMLATGLGAGWGWLRADAALRQQLDLVLAAEAEAFLRDYEIGGLPALAATAQSYARRRGPLRVSLRTAAGQVLAGDLPGAPPGLRGFATLERDAAEAGEPRRLRALGTVLPGGIALLLATDLGPAERAASALAWTPPVAGAAAAVLALLLGLLAARELERRLAAVRGAADAVIGGDLARRLPLSGRDDEFDRLAATVNAVLERIEALVTELRQVTDDVAHDLRSPMSRLRQRLEAALARARDPEADAALLEAAIAELDGVLATFAALLRIARAESGAGRDRFVALDLAALAAGMAEAYAPVAEEAGRRLEVDLPPTGSVRGDPALLRQALANLLDNALAHGDGTLRLALRPGPVLSVSDQGPGVPPEARKEVLRRFHRLDRSRNTPGTGLGLALVAAVARLHAGRLSLRDGPDGRGLEVLLDLSPRGPS